MATFDVNKDLVLGESMYLYIVSGDTNTPIAFATTCSVQIDGETIDTSNKMSGRWNSNLAGKNSYTISSDALYTQNTEHYSFDNLMKKMISAGDEAKVDWVIGAAKDYANPTTPDYSLDDKKPHYKGTGYITSLSLNAGNNEVANCSITITGSGAILHEDGTATE